MYKLCQKRGVVKQTSTCFNGTFIFESCDVSEKGVQLLYRIQKDGLALPPAHVALHMSIPNAQTSQAHALAVHVGMSLVPYLWMEQPCRKILVKPRLPSLATDFWEQVYSGVLAEFFCLNNIEPFTPSVKLHEMPGSGDTAAKVPCEACSAAEAKVLVPLGAGKDSIVCFALLSECIPTERLRWFFVAMDEEEYHSCDRFHRIAHQDSCNPLLQEGIAIAPDAWEVGFVPAGHPFACFVMFSAVLQAAAHGYQYVCLGNERSADVEDRPGVNHQWDKSSRFLCLARTYLQHFTNVHVFSAVQQWWEIQIVALFCRLPATQAYWPLFLSCNEPVDGQHWCGNCEKCLFLALCLHCFMHADRVRSLWRGADVLSNESLLPKLEEMLGQREKEPPFECVGTEREVRLAMMLATLQVDRFSHRGGYGSRGDIAPSAVRKQLPLLLQARDGSHAVVSLPTAIDMLKEVAEPDVPEWLHIAIARANELLARISESISGPLPLDEHRNS